MASFVKIESDGYVSQAIIIADENCGNLNFPESEPVGKAYISSLNLDGEWKQTSIDGSYRNMYASVGCYYNSVEDKFVIPPQE